MFQGRASVPLWGMLSWFLLLVRSASATDRYQSLNEQFGGALTESGDYLYGSDKWGDDGSGSQNMTVHAYPNVGYQSIQLPAQISNIESFQLSGSWTVFPVGEESASNTTSALSAIYCKADIALDMFLDTNNRSSTNASAASHEVMVWQSVWGGVWPIGYHDPPTGAPEYNLSGVTYQLFGGHNQQGQEQGVFSWVPTVYQESIDANVFELVRELVRLGNITEEMYLGLIQFGSETVHAEAPVELQMKDVQMSIAVTSSRTASPTPTSTKKSGAVADMYRPQITNFAVPAALGLGVMLGL
ncbi:hypothetical protein NHQ30_000856 [Ciborinia camelliae]|nr:hypothetical protein NHQ30_000856 [Ciborinia camelliae]